VGSRQAGGSIRNDAKVHGLRNRRRQKKRCTEKISRKSDSVKMILGIEHHALFEASYMADSSSCEGIIIQATVAGRMVS